MRLLLKEALVEYNERNDKKLTLADFAKKVYRGKRMRAASKVQRISNLQNDQSGYVVTLGEAVKICEVLGVDLNTFNTKFVQDGNRVH